MFKATPPWGPCAQAQAAPMKLQRVVVDAPELNCGFKQNIASGGQPIKIFIRVQAQALNLVEGYLFKLVQAQRRATVESHGEAQRVANLQTKVTKMHPERTPNKNGQKKM